MTVAIADLHLREKAPVCRTDNFWKAQEEDFNFVLKYCHDGGHDLLIAGDFTDTNPPSEYLKRWLILTIKEYRVSIYAIFGQHDTQAHSLKAWDRTGLGVLDAAGCVQLMFEPTIVSGDTIVPCHFGQPIPHVDAPKDDMLYVLIMHKMVVKSTSERNRTGFKNAISAKELADDFDEYFLILTGDNHEHFKYTNRASGTTVVNCGSFQLLKADQINHEPLLFAFDSKRGNFNFVQLPDRRASISRKHIEKTKGEDASLEAFIKSVKSQKYSINYKSNIEAFCQVNKTKEGITDLLLSNMGRKK